MRKGNTGRRECALAMRAKTSAKNPFLLPEGLPVPLSVCLWCCGKSVMQFSVSGGFTTSVRISPSTTLAPPDSKESVQGASRAAQLTTRTRRPTRQW